MQFKHPEILYTLLLLIIPIIVHLFQLQRFVKTPFTNVKFLKNIEQQTRKSARLKKWLLLTFRLLTFTCIILAFSQPYFTNLSTHKYLNTTIYLDNSFSMQAKGKNGELLKSTAQKIIENNLNNNNKISLLTNNNYFQNLDVKSLKNKLKNVTYYPNKIDLNTVLLKINNNKTKSINTLYNTFLISDFQNINLKNKLDFTNVNSAIKLIKVTPKNTFNIFVDSVYVFKNSFTEIVLKVIIKSTQNSTEKIPISLYSESKLIGKATSKFNNTKLSIIEFTIQNKTKFNGKISLTDNNLGFDNDFYFSISKPEKINVLSIGEKSHFLSRIYTENEFNFTATPLQNINYNSFQNQQLIVLNEIEIFPFELAKNLSDFSKKGGNLVIIPSKKSNINTYNTLFSQLNIGKIHSKIKREHKITHINYNHPLINNVFEKKVTNFLYPKITEYFKTTLNNSTAILNLDTNETYIASIKNENSTIYWVASPLKKEISNFTQSPIIVPLFYNFAKNSLKIAPLYYTIASKNIIDIKTSIDKDNVLKISNKTKEFIPLQVISQNKISITLQNNILQSGFYTIKNNNEPIKTIAFNYNRDESDLTYNTIQSISDKYKNVTQSTSIDAIFSEINNLQKINWLFKWFLAFSILFLLIEMLILKYFKI